MSYKFFGILLLFFVLSCGEGSQKANVGVGELISRHVVFEKSCSAGQFKVEVVSSAGNPSPDPNNLTEGAEVEISGSVVTNCTPFVSTGTTYSPTYSYPTYTPSILNTPPTFPSSSLTASSYTATSATNRATFSCKGRLVIGNNRAFVCDSGTSSLGNFLGGQFLVHGNGKKGSALVQTDVCRLSFNCF